jgi:hypothetical protein
MKYYKLIIILLIFFVTINTYGQKYYSFKTLLKYQATGKTFINKSYYDTTWRTYLGKIKDTKTKNYYYVLKEFSKVRAAATWHGHSNLYIYSKQKKLIATIDMGMPYYLPFKLHANNLYFNYTQNRTTKFFKIPIPFILPKIICFGSFGCNDVQFQ